MSPIPHTRARARLLLSAGSALLVSLALSSNAFATTVKSAEKSTSKPPSKVTFIDSPSSESPAARKKRLKIECKGRPNAGMCLGHTR